MIVQLSEDGMVPSNFHQRKSGSMAGLGTVFFYAAMAITLVAAPVKAQTCPQQFSLRDLSRLASTDDQGVSALLVEDAILVHLKNLTKIYACQASINYYAAKTGLPSAVVIEVEVETSNGIEVQFRNKINSKICGSIRYRGSMPESAALSKRARSNIDATTQSFSERFATWFSKTPSKEDEIYNRFVAVIDEAFVASRGRTAVLAENAIGPYLPSGVIYPRPTGQAISAYIHEYRKIPLNQVRAFIAEQKWSQTDVDRFIDRRGCAWRLPDVSPPDIEIFQNYPGAFDAYQQFAAILDHELPR